MGVGDVFTAEGERELYERTFGGGNGAIRLSDNDGEAAELIRGEFETGGWD